MSQIAAVVLAHFLALSATGQGTLSPEQGELVMDLLPNAQWHFEGEIGARVDANVEHWLLRAPDANPGLLEMFRRRERRLPYDEPVPWAGEFAGKYLIGAVQAMSMTDDPRVKPFLQGFVDALIAGQAEDGYLGPWPKDQRLLGHWDLWGHYHGMLGLLLWYDATGDENAYTCVLRAADCICDIYVDGGRRPIEAGTPQINLSVLHVMGQLYRRTGNARYLKLMERIEEDMQQDGDWLRQGAAGVPYYKLPGGGTRWESLHIVQGIVELYRITGEEQYKQAAVSLWRSIRDYDRHPSGAFSTNEQAFGTVYAEGSVETCCSIAWEALTIDVLRLTGDPTVADELELTTWNQALATQHPSGNWCTYDNPLNGVRAPSYHQINFQYRPGTPELNCCSVNAPRGLGMLRDWGVLEDAEGLAVNFYGPGSAVLERANGETVKLVQDTEFPVDGTVRLTVNPASASEFRLRLRIPAWSKQTSALLNGKEVGTTPQPGTYLDLKRTWKPGDTVELNFDLSPRYWAGQGPARAGRAALYRGPLLLAYDAYFNSIETPDLPAIDVTKLALNPATVDRTPRPGYFAPIGLWKIVAEDGQELTLCDFGSAGAHGTDFAAWLPASHLPPTPVSLQCPQADAAGKPGPVLFRWARTAAPDTTYALLVARDPAFSDIPVKMDNLSGNQATLEDGLQESGTYYWKVRSINPYGTADKRQGPRGFAVAPAAL